ncbi:hypothetical protein HDU99_004235 [Rhizoclosmatium hyalinum]|nr:hypothetical protein HDU99_004235 [Rhizoclosmatium hyalinum]
MSLRIGPESLYSSKNMFMTTKSDAHLRFYLSPKEEVALDITVLLGANVPFHQKLMHIEEVMFSLYSNGKMETYSHGLQGLADEWLNHTLQMVEPENSIKYDLDELEAHLRTKNPGSVAQGMKPVDLILHLTLKKLADEEICRRVSLIIYKLSTMETLKPDQSALLREIRMYVKMLGLVHLKHMLALISSTA